MKRYATKCPTCEDTVWRLYVDENGDVCCEKCETVIGPVKTIRYEVVEIEKIK